MFRNMGPTSFPKWTEKEEAELEMEMRGTFAEVLEMPHPPDRPLPTFGEIWSVAYTQLNDRLEEIDAMQPTRRTRIYAVNDRAVVLRTILRACEKTGDVKRRQAYLDQVKGRGVFSPRMN